MIGSALALCVAACAPPSPQHGALPSASPSPVGSARPLRVGTSGDYPPFSVAGGGGSLAGFDVAVARAYAKERGRDLELVRFRWPELESRLARGDFDVAMSGVTVRGDRVARAPMTAAVARADAVLVVGPRVGPVDPRRGGAGLKLAVNRGGHLESVAHSILPRADLRTVEDNRSLPALLSSGEVDGVVTDTLELKSFSAPSPAASTGSAAAPPAIALVLSSDRKAYWVRPDAALLAADLDAFLVEREADGTLPALRARSGVDPRGAFEPQARIVDLVARRLTLMPLVARAKQQAGLPIDVPAREAAIEQAARRAAQADGLDETAYLALVRAQIEAAKAVQRAVLERPDAPPSASSGGLGGAASRAPASPGNGDAPAFDLERDLRPAIDRTDAAIRRELVRSAPLATSRDVLAAELLEEARVPGLDRDLAAQLADALASIPAAAPRPTPVPPAR